MAAAIPALLAQDFISEEPDSIHAIYERALAGSADDQNEVGGWYFRGVHVERNYPQAVQWWLRAAQGENAKATGNLGICYRFGLGVRQDSVRATRLILKSIKDGNPALLDSVSAGADRGDVFYNSLMAWRLHTTRSGVDFFPDSAVTYLERAAQAGSMENMKRLALNHYNRRNYTEAYRWFSSAADADSVNSMFYVGQMLLQGKGVEKNESLGFEKVNIAAQAGNRNALYLLGQCYNSGTGVEADPALALKFYTLASGKGLSKASWDAAKCYLNGVGTATDYPLASIYFSRYTTQASGERFRKLITDTIPDSPFVRYMRGNKALSDSNFVSAMEDFNILAESSPELGRFLTAYAGVNAFSEQDSIDQCIETIIEVAPEIPLGKFVLGTIFLQSNPAQAEQWFLSAGDDGYGVAFGILGHAYYYGIGVEQDYDKAVPYLLRAMELGQLTEGTDTILAECYENGLGGLSPDPDLAAKIRSGEFNLVEKNLYQFF